VQDAKLLLWGCSATLRRHDGLGLSAVFERIAYHRGLLDVMREGWCVAQYGGGKVQPRG